MSDQSDAHSSAASSSSSEPWQCEKCEYKPGFTPKTSDCPCCGEPWRSPENQGLGGPPPAWGSPYWPPPPHYPVRGVQSPLQGPPATSSYWQQTAYDPSQSLRAATGAPQNLPRQYLQYQWNQQYGQHPYAQYHSWPYYPPQAQTSPQQTMQSVGSQPDPQTMSDESSISQEHQSLLTAHFRQQQSTDVNIYHPGPGAHVQQGGHPMQPQFPASTGHVHVQRFEPQSAHAAHDQTKPGAVLDQSHHQGPGAHVQQGGHPMQPQFPASTGHVHMQPFEPQGAYAAHDQTKPEAVLNQSPLQPSQQLPQPEHPGDLSQQSQPARSQGSQDQVPKPQHPGDLSQQSQPAINQGSQDQIPKPQQASQPHFLPTPQPGWPQPGAEQTPPTKRLSSDEQRAQYLHSVPIQLSNVTMTGKPPDQSQISPQVQPMKVHLQQQIPQGQETPPPKPPASNEQQMNQQQQLVAPVTNQSSSMTPTKRQNHFPGQSQHQIQQQQASRLQQAPQQEQPFQQTSPPKSSSTTEQQAQNLNSQQQQLAQATGLLPGPSVSPQGQSQQLLLQGQYPGQQGLPGKSQHQPPTQQKSNNLKPTPSESFPRQSPDIPPIPATTGPLAADNWKFHKEGNTQPPPPITQESDKITKPQEAGTSLSASQTGAASKKEESKTQGSDYVSGQMASKLGDKHSIEQNVHSPGPRQQQAIQSQLNGKELSNKRSQNSQNLPGGSHQPQVVLPPCQYCGKLLLTCDAKLCESCGRQQRKDTSASKNALNNENLRKCQDHPLSEQIPDTVQEKKSKQKNSHRPGKKDTTSGSTPSQGYRKAQEPGVLYPGTDRNTRSAMHSVSLSGLAAPLNKSVDITFHFLISKEYWEWEPGKSSVHIRFGHKDLGQWTDCGKFEEVREFDDGLMEMIFNFKSFAVDILKFPLPYKYVVHSPKHPSGEDGYEYLHAHTTWKSADFNRCLVIPPQKLLHLRGGKYHHYDTISYPKSTYFSSSYKKSWKDRAKGFFGGVFGFNKGKDEPPDYFTTLTHQEMNTTCVYNYLQQYQEMLNNGMFVGHSISTVATTIAHIYRSLCTDFICPVAHEYPQVKALDKGVQMKEFEEDLFTWFESIVTHIHEGALENSQKVLSSLCILHCLNMPDIGLLSKCNRNNEKFLLALASMISFLSTETDVNLTGIEWSVLAKDVFALCGRIAFKVPKFAVEWFLLLPVHYRLDGTDVKPSLDFKFNTVLYNNLGLQSIQKKAESETHFVELYYDRVKDYFDLEPSLQKLFVHITPKAEFPALCKCVPPYLVTEVLVQQASSKNKLEVKVLQENIEQVKSAYLRTQTPQHLYAMVKSATTLCETVFPKSTLHSEKYMDLMKVTVSCALFAIQQIYEQNLSETEVGRNELKSAIQRLSEALSNWIADPKVIGGSIFGYHVPKYENSSKKGTTVTGAWKGKQELEVWQSLLSLNITPGWEVCEDWENIIRNHVNRRVYAVSSEKLKVDLVIEMEKIENVHPALSEVIMEAALQAVDVLLSQPEKYRMMDVGKLAARESERVGQLLGRIIEKSYPNPVEEVTVADLFGWNLWPKFITVYDCRPKLLNGLPKHCQRTCKLAKEAVVSLCDQIKTGDVQVSKIKLVASNRDHMVQLYEAAYGYVGDAKRFSDLKAAIRKCVQNFERFCDFHSRLLHLCRHIDIEVQGLNDLNKALNENYDAKAMNVLCTTGESSPEDCYTCFQSARSLSLFSSKFYIMSHEHGCNLFASMWKKAMEQASTEKTNLTFDDVLHSIWELCLNDCKHLLLSLSELTTELADIDNKLKLHQSSLETQLDSLAKGIIKCTNVEIDQSSISLAVMRIKQYWELCRFQEGANIFLTIRNSLGLTKGDFTLVEKLSKELTSFGDQKLCDINDGLIQAGKFLEDIAKDEMKVDCLQRFSKCHEIVRWLKETTKDVNEIQSFVNVALATAAGGEGDLSHDKLSHLRTVGSGYGSLIYGLSETTGFIELKEACSSLWVALENNPHLPKLLEDCNKDIGWYKSVKDTQGSVEVTSFGQMRNILMYGHFIIGTTLQSNVVYDIYHLISLKLVPRDKPLTKTSYNLEELRDLESKLVLITGSKAENRTEVDHYLNILQHVARIAEALLALQQAGNVKYSGWMMNFNCATYIAGQGPKQEPQLEVNSAKDRVVELKRIAKYMESELEAWVNELAVSRSKFYKLNYYTTLQVLRLRKELWQCHKSVDPEVLSLLYSISADVDSEVVHSVVTEIIKNRKSISEIQKKDEDIMSTEMESVDVQIEENCEPIQITTEDPKNSNNTSQEEESPVSPPPITSGEVRESSSMGLAEDALNDKQKEIYYDLTEYSGYNKLLVLKAIEECPDLDQYDIEIWCDQHEGTFEHRQEQKEDTTSTSEDEELTTSDGEVSLLETEIASPASVAAKRDHDHEPVVIPVVRTIHKPIIDEVHPAVQELVNDYEYEVRDAIEAVQLCGSLSKAMDYLTKKENEGDSGINWIQAAWEPDKDESESIVVYDDTKVEEKYLSLEELGNVLENLGVQLSLPVTERRTFVQNLKAGAPNLIVTAPDDVLKTVLSLYMEDEMLPLPTLSEVLICNSSTTTEEVCLLWRRAISDPDFKRIFCLAHAEKLSYQVCDMALESLKELSQGKQGYRLVIICSKDSEDKSFIISKLILHKKSFIIKHSDEQYQKYLKHHFVNSNGDLQACASAVDIERSHVRIVSSNRGGMGKSLFIKRMAERLSQECTSQKSVYAAIPIHGPLVTSDVILKFFMDHYEDDKRMIYHLDIAPSVLSKVDTLLFSLLILHGLSDSQGHIWRCHPTHLYAVEVTLPGTVEKQECLPEASVLQLLCLLPSVECLSPKQVFQSPSLGTFQIGMDQEEFQTTAQRVYHYLRRQKAKEDLDKYKFSNIVEGNIPDCLDLFLQNCGVKDPSWSEIHHFYKFLDLQLDMCENSVFCDRNIVGDVLAGLKGFIVSFMIRMSRDFATPSLKGEVVKENQLPDTEEVLEKYEIEERRQWEHSAHPCIFFNRDKTSFTFVGFIINKDGDLLDNHEKLLEHRIMSKQLYEGLKRQTVNLSDDHTLWSKQTMINKIATVMGLSDVKDPDETYVLTVDNVIKILAIQTRFRCGIPVVIMGETGCGKTRLIRYMCDLAKEGNSVRNMLILKVHGGTKEEDIVKFITAAEEEAKRNKSDTVVFFDEANTTDALGLIKEILCDQRLNGKRLSEDLKFIAACNPYRKHSKEMIEKLESAGLGFYVKDTDTHQRLGKIPLRQLVYRVLDLPPSMRPLVYDFGQLNRDTEDNYIKHIVNDHIRKDPLLSKEAPGIIPIVTDVLATSQIYMRERKDECSFVSLRDVERTMLVFKYFCSKMDDFRKADDQSDEANDEEHPSNTTSALILSLSVCYQARLQDRLEYQKKVAEKFKSPLDLPGGDEQFRNEIKWCQNVLLDNMVLGPNIAKNAALRENVFMMAICVELRIPLFVVGKPGSSKSLAKSIIQDSMHGNTSITELLRKFKRVHIFSYQCSQLSTSESILEVFKSARRFQSNQDNFISVVVLDEVGLAEDSPNLPLKALHPLLEDGSEGAGAEGRDEIISREDRVSFIGISNWALDPAKMNRGVMVTRGAPDVKELEYSAEGICGKGATNSVKTSLKPFFKPLAEAYEAICGKQKREFFGLRDFYSLIKMLFWMCTKSNGRPLTWPQMKHAILRNFGGLESEDLDPFEEFRSRLDMLEVELKREDYSTSEIWNVVNPDCSRLGLIKTSLDTRETSFHGENRYLLFLTENYAALDILEHYIRGKKVEKMQTTDSQYKISEDDALDQKPFTLFGSSFPKDKEYTQVCRNINQIKICMETGRTVILLNLENLYESLYDVLNQYYMHYGDSRYVDLGLQTHRVKCRVHKNFKLILIAERSTVYERFPTPLINRLEKHFVLTSSILKKWQMDILIEFEDWIKGFSIVRDGDFKEQHAFIGYQRDTAAAVIFQACRQLKQLTKEPMKYTALRQSGILDDVSLVELYIIEEISAESVDTVGSEKEILEKGELVTKKRRKNIDLWKYAVLKLSQYFILLTATDDALIRLKKTALADQQNELVQLYFLKQHHNSIIDFMQYQIECDDGSQNGLLVQVTTHSHLLSLEELKFIEKSINMEIEAFLLQEFDTELDFSNKIGPVFQREITDSDNRSQLIVIQCDSGDANGDLIACARYRIYDERVKSIKQQKDAITHVLFIINLPHELLDSSFVGFQGDPWISAHIDDLKPSSEATIQPQEAISETISKIFIGGYLEDSLVPQQEKPVGDIEIHEMPTKQFKPQNAQCRRLHSCIQAAVSKLEDASRDRSTQRVSILTKLIPREPPLKLDQNSFYGVLVTRIYALLCEREAIRRDLADWVLREALNTSKLEVGGTFRNVLARKIDEVVIPIFSKIIGCIDCNCNLDLISGSEDSLMTLRGEFWIAVFKNSNIVHLKYSEMVQGNSMLGTSRRAGREFKCQMPFFWLIKETVDSVQDDARSRAGEGLQAQHQQLCAFIQNSSIGELLQTVKSSFEEFYSFYLHDFVLSTHMCKHKTLAVEDLEYKVVTKSLDSLVQSLDLCTAENTDSLVSRIAALHLAFEISRSQILWFSQLASHSPGILKSLYEEVHSPDIQEMDLHLNAAMRVMTKMKPPLHKDDPIPNLMQWLNYVRLSQTVIDSIVALDSQSKLLHEARLLWTRIKAMKLFVEHVMMKITSAVDIKLYARRLWGRWEKDSDFLKVGTIENVKLQLSNLEQKVKKEDKEKSKDIRKYCSEFFLQIVSNLCFGGDIAPESKLIKMLLGTMFAESTQELTPYSKVKTDEVPTIRSFLLQLLLEHSTSDVREHMNEYFSRSCYVLSGKQADQDLYLLIIKCFEDSLSKALACQELSSKTRMATNIIYEGMSALKSHKLVTPSLEYLEGVAKMRSALVVIAEMLVNGNGEVDQDLLKAAETLCTDDIVNCINKVKLEKTVGPVIYLIKLLARQYGIPQLKAISESYDWVIPAVLLPKQFQSMDLFVIYGDVYKTIRKGLSSLLFTNKVENFDEAVQHIQQNEVICFLLALYEEATLSQTGTEELQGDVIEKVDDFIKTSKYLTEDLRLTARALLGNQQGGNVLAQMDASPDQPLQCRILTGLVVHAASVFFSRCEEDMLLVFVNILTNPAALNESYLPTVPEDPFQELMEILRGNDEAQGTYHTGKFYECPRGHIYFVGDCGGVYYSGKCNVCQSPIGGSEYKLAENNKVYNFEDSTKKGHDLSAVQSRVNAKPERCLSARSVCILRALMHSSLVWSCCHNNTAAVTLAPMVHPQEHPNNLPELFWRHLEKDIELLSKDIGRGLEETVALVHIVLKQMLAAPAIKDGSIQRVNLLKEKGHRKEWEEMFDKHYILPILNSLDQEMEKALNLFTKDDQIGDDRLFYLIFEKMDVAQDVLAPHLWTYRSRITLEHLRQTMRDKKLKKKYKILHEFLQTETELRATQYLPDIVKLQHCLYDKCNRQIDIIEAKKQTIKNFIKQLPNERVRSEYHRMIASLGKAWKLVGQRLSTHGRLAVKEEYCISDITEDTCMEFIVPTTSDAGACTTALVDFLTLTHNNFIASCRSVVAEQDQSTLSFWREHNVPITHLHRCHLLDYEQQLPSVILSHCQYSLRVGKGQDVKYDYQALEKHLLNRFIHGKPIILVDIPQVVYRKDIYSIVTFSEVRNKVKPQVALTLRVKQDILSELRSLDRLRETLDVIEIVLGFLSSGGGKPEKNLGEYVDKTLRMKTKRVSQRAKKECQLKHILSLWETVAVELAKKLCLKKQEPFEAMNPKYLRELSKNEDGEDQFAALDRCLGQFEPDNLLGILYEFIEIYIKHSPEHEYDQPLSLILEIVLDQYGIELPQLGEFPESIKLDQAVAAWKHIAQYTTKKH